MCLSALVENASALRILKLTDVGPKPWVFDVNGSRRRERKNIYRELVF